jgi:hypothetical protein
MRNNSEAVFQHDVLRDVASSLGKHAHVINLRRGTFDAIADTPSPQLIEFKLMQDFRKRRGRGSINDKFGIQFTKPQSQELKQIKWSFPVVAVWWPKRNKYYLLKPRFVKNRMKSPTRQEKPRVIISVKYFPRSLTYQELVKRLARLIANYPRRT